MLPDIFKFFMKFSISRLLTIFVLFLTTWFCQAQNETNATLASTAAEPVSADDSRPLNKMDKLWCVITEDPVKESDPEEATVNAEFKLIVKVSRGFEQTVELDVKDKTLGQVKKELKRLLDENYYHDSHIDLKIRDRTKKPGTVFFYGKGARGNFIQLSPGQEVTLFEGLMQAGVTEFANLKKIVLDRKDPVSGVYKKTTYNVEDIKKNRTKDIPLQDEDRVEVPERSIMF